MTEPAAFRPYDQLDLSPFADLPPACWSPELHRAGAVVSATVGARCAELVASRPEVRQDRRHAWRRIESLASDRRGPVEAQGLGSTLQLIERATAHYPDWLAGRIDGDAVLFCREALPLWAAYFDNDNLCYAAVNRLAAWAAAGAAPARPLRVLELGAGCGSGTQALLEALPGELAHYTATDAAPALMSIARRRLGCASLQFLELDLDLPLAAQRLEVPAGGFDLIFAVNTLHAVRDLLFSLRELGGVLADDGALVLGEGIRPHPATCVPIEYLFQLDRRYQSVRTDPDFRPGGGFLFHGHWPVALARAGYCDVKLLPEMTAAIAAYPGYSMAAVVARR